MYLVALGDLQELQIDSRFMPHGRPLAVLVDMLAAPGSFPQLQKVWLGGEVFYWNGYRRNVDDTDSDEVVQEPSDYGDLCAVLANKFEKGRLRSFHVSLEIVDWCPLRTWKFAPQDIKVAMEAELPSGEARSQLENLVEKGLDFAMLWVPFCRNTRSGAIYGEFLRLNAFKVDQPLKSAVAIESDVQRDHEGSDDDDDNHTHPEDDGQPEDDGLDDPPSLVDGWNDVDDIPPSQPPPSDHWDAVDDLPPPAKRRRFDMTTEPPLKGPHRRRKAKVKANVAANGHDIRPSTVAKHLRPAIPIRTSLASQTLPTAHGAYVASLEDAKELYGSKKRWTLESLVERGFLVVPWDGKRRGRWWTPPVGCLGPWLDNQMTPATPRPLRGPSMPSFARDTLPNSPLEKKHRRGLFAAINVGVSYGQGQTKPSWLKSDYEATAERLLANTDIQRMALFASATFRLWAPRLYEYYLSHNKLLDALQASPALLGLRVLRRRLQLRQECVDFPPPRRAQPSLWLGGHLILWDLKLVIEFPAGALILIPSATLAHSNIPVQNDETRTSFTQFTAGGVFRYVDNDFRTEEELQAQDPIAYEAMLAEKERRWEMGLGLWSTIDELVDAGRYVPFLKLGASKWRYITSRHYSLPYHILLRIR
ncbi:hypothetical protein HMN09_00824400 [Mycena chlorophos]|uniref:Uncharacterized protein n=1 Tax=Mycena chlorophos TaxID=658473 RepID=A0A8H6SRS5_MYCCL|nr:hypothetical protein HMN09_00824400 [Mycena chlorophos]